MCRVNSYEANYRQHSVDASNYIMDKHKLMHRHTWRLVVSLTPLPLYPRGKSLRYPLYRRFGVSQSRLDHMGENSCPHRDSNSEPSVVQPRSQSLYGLRYLGSTLLEMHFNILSFTTRSDKWSVHRSFLIKIMYALIISSCMLRVPPSPSLFDQPNNIWWSV
jgi:hypothetical protein